jgi:molybdopterin-guanine dinucleotide biosynthesis protein A
MGRDKAAIQVEGVSLAMRTARLLTELFEDALLVGGRPSDATPGRRVADLPGPRCGLRGLASALAAARAERVVVVATDMPHLSAELVLGLTAYPEHDAVVPRTAEGSHPLCAIYRREPVVARARERLERGELALRGLLDAVDTAWLEGADLALVDPGGRALANVNTPEDLAQAVGATADA